MHITNDLKTFYEKFNILVNLLIRRSQRHKYRTKLYLRKLGPASEISPALKNHAHLEQHRKAPSLGNLWLYKEKRCALAGAGSVHTTVNSLYSGHCRYLDRELVSTLARVRYSESFFPSNLWKFSDFCLGFNCCQGVRFCGVSARQELTVYQSAFTQTSIRLSLFSKDVKVEQSFSSSGSLFHKLAALNINDRCPCDCLIRGNFKLLLLFFVSLT